MADQSPTKYSASQRPPDSPVTASFASLKSNIDTLIVKGAVLASGTTQNLPPTTGKEPLSLQTTSVNFRKFVQKSGPLFAAQDAVEAVLRWDDVPQTLFFGASWAFLCLYPALLFVLPNIVVTTVLLYTYSQRPATLPPSPSGEHGPDEKLTPLASLPPAEGSVDYLANLTHIQHLMGFTSDLSDFGRSFVPYLSWTDERTTLVILQVTVLSGLFIGFLAPLVPWRYVFLFLGEALLISGHPVSVGLMSHMTPLLAKEGRKWNFHLGRLVEDDSLSEEELDGELIEVERFDSESRIDGTWVGDVVIGGDLPSSSGGSSAGTSWRWISQGDWLVDVLGDWADGKVDEAGWTYLFIDGTRSSFPNMNATTSTGTSQANSRRRRLVRRAWRPAPSTSTS